MRAVMRITTTDHGQGTGSRAATRTDLISIPNDDILGDGGEGILII